MFSVKSYGKEKEIERSFSYHLKAAATLPLYMEKNLREMPNNKGYIWKSIYYYGYLPAEKDKPSVVFDRDSRTKILTIHEWSSTEYKVFEKQGTDRKRLVYKQKRKLSTG